MFVSIGRCSWRTLPSTNVRVAAGHIPVLLLCLADGVTLDVCHIVALADTWFSIAYFRDPTEGDEADTAFVPYGLVQRFVPSAHPPQVRRIGFDIEKSAAAGGGGGACRWCDAADAIRLLISTKGTTSCGRRGYEHSEETSGPGRVAPPARLEPAHAGLVAEGHRGGVGRQSRGSLWIKRGREGGMAALRTRPHSGGPANLTAEQRARIPRLLARGAHAYGFRGEVWTATRVAEVIWRTFGVRYHRDHVGRLLRWSRWSRRRPIRRATQRNKAAIRRWHDERWPAIKKRRATKATPSSGETKPRFTCCRTRCGPGPRAARRPCCA